MADIIFSGVLDGTTLNCELSLSFENREKNSVLVNYTALTYLNSQGYSGGGYEEYSGEISVFGTYIEAKTEKITLKPKSEAWQGSTKHYKKGSFLLNLSQTGIVYPNITYTVKTTADSKTLKGSTQLTCKGYISPAPPNPASLILSESNLHYGKELTVRWAACTGALGYRVYQSINDNEFVLVADTSETQFTYMPLGEFGDRLRIKVAPYSEEEATGKVSEYISFIGGAYLKVDGVYLPATPYIKVNSAWVRAKCIYLKKGGSWCYSL